MAKLFTKEELEELRRIDAELDEEFSLSQEDMDLSRRLDRDAKLDRLDNRGRRKAARSAAYYEANKEKIAARSAAYREANKEKIADYQAAYREANKEKIADYQAAYYEANKQKIRDQQRRYRQRKREEKRKAASDGANIESGKGNISTSILTL